MFKKMFSKLFGKKEEISFKQGFELTELPIITLKQGNIKLNFLLDTGSNDSIIDSNILKNLSYTKIDATSSLVGVEGITKDVNMCELTVSYKDIDYTYQYIISDMKGAFDKIKQCTGVSLHGIIGSKFFNEYRYVLDFAELIAYSKS